MYEEFVVPERKSFRILREIYDWMESGVIAVLAVVLVFAFAARMVGVDGDSMLPTLESGDKLVSTVLYSELKAGDIAVVTKPNSRNNEPLIKRVIATEGQTIDIDFATGDVYVDSVLLDEPYIFEHIRPESAVETVLPAVVPEGHIFVMGDNRNNSWDSRVAEIGMVDQRFVLGKVIFRVSPYDKFGSPYPQQEAS